MLEDEVELLVELVDEVELLLELEEELELVELVLVEEVEDVELEVELVVDELVVQVNDGLKNEKSILCHLHYSNSFIVPRPCLNINTKSVRSGYLNYLPNPYLWTRFISLGCVRSKSNPYCRFILK